MPRRFLFIALLLLLGSPANAFWHGHLNVVSAPSGISQINLGANEQTSEEFTNIFKMCTLNIQTNSQTLFDADGYPIGTLTTSATCSMQNVNTTGPYKVSCPSTRFNCSFSFGTAANVTSNVNYTVTNGGGSGNPTLACSNAAGCSAWCGF